VDRLPIDRVELDRMLQEPERDERRVDVQNDRVPNVRYGDAVPDSRRSHRLARLEDTQKRRAVLLGGKRKPGHELPQHVPLVPGIDVVEDAAGSKEL
jgi:hypothetical protein